MSCYFFATNGYQNIYINVRKFILYYYYVRNLVHYDINFGNHILTLKFTDQTCNIFHKNTYIEWFRAKLYEAI